MPIIKTPVPKAIEIEWNHIKGDLYCQRCKTRLLTGESEYGFNRPQETLYHRCIVEGFVFDWKSEKGIDEQYRAFVAQHVDNR